MESDCLRSWAIHLVLVLSTSVTCLKEVTALSDLTTDPFQFCHPVKQGMLNVHLVPHSHDDVGWLKTVDQYYYGSKQEIQKAGVQYILDSVTDELLINPDRRFVQVETYYLWRWFREQKAKKQQQVKELVRSGRLAIANGGITSSDEATTYYQCLIDQLTWGFRRIHDMFGAEPLPLAAWKIDSFGHSREMSSILAQMGFNGVFFARIDYQDKYNRLQDKTAELVWQTSASLGTSSHLFTSIFNNHYSAPSGFCFDILCNDEPVNDDPNSRGYNVDEKVNNFINFARNVAKFYVTNNIIVPMGDDFHYQDAHVNFKNMDKLIWYVNERQQQKGSMINVLYSTPSCYLKAVNEANVTWPLKYDDFFPYGSDYHSYWTGFYTSRPNLKYFERLGNNYLQVCKQLFVLAVLNTEDLKYLDALRDALGIMQHHDAITGTEKQNVADDYALILHKAITGCEKITNNALRKLMHKNKDESSHQPEIFESCLLLNISDCAISEKSQVFTVTVYNPLSYVISHYVRLPVTGVSYSVRDPAGTQLPVQLVPIPSQLFNLPGRKSKATVEMVFKAEDVPPLGYKSYYVEELPHRVRGKSDLADDGMDSTIGNKNFQIIFDELTGLIEAVKKNGTLIPLRQNFLFYNSASGGSTFSGNRASGAYIFRPNEQYATPVTEPTIMGMNIYKGEIVDEIHQIFTDWISQVVRVYKDDNHFELEWLAGPIPVNGGSGKEVISRFSTNFENNGTFYTDSNGREMIKRIRNYRPTWDVKVKEPISANYYPVTTKIVINDNKTKQHLAVFTDRSQGGTSHRDGQLELMIHRRTLHDDGLGVGEALNEQQYGKGLIARGKHYVVLAVGNKPGKTALEKDIAQRRGMSPLVFLAKTSYSSFEKWAQKHKTEFSGVKQPLPRNIKILTLEPWSNNTILLRLEHLFEKGEDDHLSKSVTIDLRAVMASVTQLGDAVNGHPCCGLAVGIQQTSSMSKSSNQSLPMASPITACTELDSSPVIEWQLALGCDRR
ncbi:lysosomal alpha-mannosidase-like isoform X2 [Schistocerca gregaria]|uniref:lysosomal alpha-mannosidase-like isoform X2 n=1 Tax=Schistocerca gregaria TaxID=7010 RepID=UPI00211ED51A|nr:lysosomal alpha-mannosidase-like isoform X2 [Schistocerca gregaria]XP_049836999.1 lysosomal alpha-mannosidase-like isoform X2 [Schistocerca gregaria]